MNFPELPISLLPRLLTGTLMSFTYKEMEENGSTEPMISMNFRFRYLGIVTSMKGTIVSCKDTNFSPEAFMQLLAASQDLTKNVYWTFFCRPSTMTVWFSTNPGDDFNLSVLLIP